MPHVVHASFRRDPLRRRPHELIAAWSTLTDIASAVASAGVDVAVVVPNAEALVLNVHSVPIHFAPNVVSTVRRLNPQVIHINGLVSPLGIANLCKAFNSTPVLVQHHGGQPPQWWEVPLLRWGIRGVNGVAFTAREQADQYSSVLGRGTRVFDVVESSSHFTPGDKASARRATGLFGNPCVSWVGRLNKNKDPITALRAVAKASSELPELHFWCCFGSSELLGAVQQFVTTAGLKNRVHLLGAVPHAEIEQFMRASDIFLSTSLMEGSGYALIEALSCGVAPVVSNIPPFRAITNQGAVGALATPRDDEAFATALIRVGKLDREKLRSRCLEHFQQHLTFSAIGQRLKCIYEAMLEVVDNG